MKSTWRLNQSLTEGSACAWAGQAEPAMPFQHPVKYTGSPQQQAACTTCIFKGAVCLTRIPCLLKDANWDDLVFMRQKKAVGQQATKPFFSPPLRRGVRRCTLNSLNIIYVVLFLQHSYIRVKLTHEVSYKDNFRPPSSAPVLGAQRRMQPNGRWITFPPGAKEPFQLFRGLSFSPLTAEMDKLAMDHFTDFTSSGSQIKELSWQKSLAFFQNQLKRLYLLQF